jgi:hypothetical protein
MGSGAEQCLAYQKGFFSISMIEDLFHSIGVKLIHQGVG